MNFIFLLADQHQAGLLGCEGSSQVLTPNLDRLASQGTTFKSAYCQSPICTPSRVSFLSGQYPHNHGYFGLSGRRPSALPNFLGHFRAQGFLTAAIGKLHLPDDPRDWIADDVDLYANCYRTVDGRAGHSSYFDEIEELGLRHLEDSRMLPELQNGFHAFDSRPSRMPLEHCVEHWCARQANAFIDRARKEGRQFCMQVSFPRPHHQLTPDPSFWNLYPDDIEPPATLFADASHRPPHFRKKASGLRENHWLFEPKTFDHGVRRMWRGYLACISQVDWACGLILSHLDKCGLAGDTVIVYSSDHGAYHGEFGIPEKAPGICSEAVCRIPMIWRVPGVTAPGGACRQLVESVDLAATVPGLCGVAPMRSTDGCDLLPLLEGANVPVHDVAVTENPWSKAVRWDRWRYVHYPSGLLGEDDWAELYDVEADPSETQNLALREDCRDLVTEGRRRILDWLIKTSRPVSVHPTYGDPAPGDHHYDLAEDGREANGAGVRMRIERGALDYL